MADQQPPPTGAQNDAAKVDDPDAELVARAIVELPYRTGAYEALMNRHQALLYKVCLRLVGNAADAEDICQDVMFKVFGSLPRFEGRSTFKTWLLRIATNTAHTLRDRLRRTRELAAVWSQDPAVDKEDAISTDAMDVHSLLERLKPVERELLTLRYVADLSLEEIAEVCDMGLSATKMRIYRATEQLRAMTEQETWD